ncbi:MAG: hypothetical protein Q7T20_04830 [Saprospiraceae bacterium]|nr:hypothetical protein [Saprospiraceae bacterium]
MKNSGTFKASSSLLGALVFISLFGRVAFTSLDAFTEIYSVFKTQWHNFSESLSMMQPHRTVFPN